MTDRKLTWRKTLLVAYEAFGGEADYVSITHFVADLINWDEDWGKLHTKLSKYRGQLTESGHLEKVRHPSTKGHSLHRLTTAGREAGSGLLSDEGEIPDWYDLVLGGNLERGELSA